MMEVEIMTTTPIGIVPGEPIDRLLVRMRALRTMSDHIELDPDRAAELERTTAEVWRRVCDAWGHDPVRWAVARARTRLLDVVKASIDEGDSMDRMLFRMTTRALGPDKRD